MRVRSLGKKESGVRISAVLRYDDMRNRKQRHTIASPDVEKAPGKSVAK